MTSSTFVHDLRGVQLIVGTAGRLWESLAGAGGAGVLTISQNPVMPNTSLDALPTSEAVADDLEKIVAGLARYKSLTLAALRSLPSIRAWTPGKDGFTERERSNMALVAAIADAIGRFLHDQSKEALIALFTFERPNTDLGDRQDAAGAHLSITGDAMRKSRQRALLRELADELFRGELAWCLDQVEAAANNPVGAWYEILEWERTVIISRKNPAQQEWTTRILLRARVPAHPIFTMAQRWSGSGSKQPGKVTILSGPQGKNDPFRHRLVAVRPEQRSVDPFMLYVFDLGHFMTADKEIELAYRQVLTDTAGTYKPMLGFSTLGHPAVRLVRLRALIPGVDEGEAYTFDSPHEAPGTIPSAQGYALPSVLKQSRAIKQGDDGYLTCEITRDVPNRRYELWWGPLT